MPSGVTSVPATFQAVMNQVFGPYLHKFILVFFDDILLYSACLNSHKKHLRKVLQNLRDHQLFAKMRKCAFGVGKVK